MILNYRNLRRRNVLKLITFQHKEVLREIEDKGYYMCSKISDYHRNTPNSYQFLKNTYKKKSPNSPIIYPIFTWSQVLSIGVPPNENEGKCIERMLEMTGCPHNQEKNYYMLVLEVPTENVLETDFYSFVDMRCEEEFGEKIFTGQEDFDRILTPREQGVIEVQAIIGSINKDMIIKTEPVINCIKLFTKQTN